MRLWQASFPITIGAYLCVTLWLQRTGGESGASSLIDLFGSIATTSAIAILSAWGARRLTSDRNRRSMVALVAVLWSILFGSYSALSAPVLGSDVLVFVSWALLGGALAIVIVRGRSELSAIPRILPMAGALLLGFTVPPLLGSLPKEPTASTWGPNRRDSMPDLYIIVPDKYSSSEWLARTYGLDRAPFEDSLRALGFVLPRGLRANYAHTRLALPTFMEGAYVLLPADSGVSTNYAELSTRIQLSPLWKELQSYGYRVAFFPTTFVGTRSADGPDLTLRAPQRSAAQFAATWYVNSPLPSLQRLGCRLVPCERERATPFPLEPIETLHWKARMLSTLPDSAGPIAAFVHLISPHEPYLFDESCGARDPWWPLSETDPRMAEAQRHAYATQVRCLDQILLRTVTTLILKSETSPAIILQSDHGHAFITVDALRGITLERQDLTPDRLAERMSVFGAYRFAGADSLLYDGMSPVNVMPAIRHALFGQPLVRQPDRSFWSSYQRPMVLSEVGAFAPARADLPVREPDVPNN